MRGRWNRWWQGQVRLYLACGTALAAACLLLFANLAEGVLTHEMAGFDVAVSGWIGTWHSPAMTALMRLATAMGTSLVVAAFAVAGLVVLWRRHARRQAFALLTGLLGAVGVMELLKRLFQRPRPPGPWLTDATGFSFPSGHATVSVAFYGLLAYLLARALVPRHWRPTVLVLSGLWIACVGISRIYLGVHYPSDVAAGFAVGGAWGALCLMVARVWERPPERSSGRPDVPPISQANTEWK